MNLNRRIIKLLFFSTLFILIYYNSDSIVTKSRKNKTNKITNYKLENDFLKIQNYDFMSIEFDLKTDLIVLLHVPKTGGTDLEKKLVKHLKIVNKQNKYSRNACMKKPNLNKNSKDLKNEYYCSRGLPYDSKYELTMQNSWLFVRPTFGWGIKWECGAHADFTELKLCTENIRQENEFLRNLHFITIIREPLARYVSHWEHILNIIKTEGTKLKFFGGIMCNQPIDLKGCLPNVNLKNMTLEEFSSCEDYNAYNMQTRLLAHYEFKDKNCTLFKKENKKELLLNAKKVLEGMPYFALTEYEELSQKLFEKTFKNSLIIDHKVTLWKHGKYSTTAFIKKMDTHLKEKIIKLNNLDYELYNFAKKIFFERLRILKINIS